MIGYRLSSILHFAQSQGQLKAKWTRPIYTLIDHTSLSIKNLSYGKKESFSLWDQSGKSQVGKMGPDSQSEHRIHFIMPTHGFSDIKKEKQNTSINKVRSKTPPFLTVSLKPISKLQINVFATWLLLIGQNWNKKMPFIHLYLEV